MHTRGRLANGGLSRTVNRVASYFTARTDRESSGCGYGIRVISGHLSIVYVHLSRFRFAPTIGKCPRFFGAFILAHPFRSSAMENR